MAADIEHSPDLGGADPEGWSVSQRTRHAASKPGFMTGALSLLEGVRALLSEPRSWPFALVPALLLLVSASGGVLAALLWVQPWLHTWQQQVAGTWWQFGASVVTWLGTGLAAVFGILAALALTPVLSAPALEKLIRIQEAALGLRPRVPMGVFREMWCGLRSQLFAFGLSAPLLLLLLVVDLIFPVAAVVTVPLKLFIGALAVAWNLLDYPLTLAGVRVRERVRILWSYGGATLGFGAAFAVLFWIPCFGILALPIGVIAATRLLARLGEHDPTRVRGYQAAA